MASHLLFKYGKPEVLRDTNDSYVAIKTQPP